MDPTRRKGMHVKVKVFGPLLCLIQAYGRNVQIQVHCIRNLCKKLVIPCEGLKLMNPQSFWKTSMRFGTITPPPLKPTKVTLINIILCNSENNIRDERPFCHPLFCHSSAVKYNLSLL